MIPWLILFLPLFSAILITFCSLGRPKLSALIAFAGIFSSFLMSCGLAYEFFSQGGHGFLEISIPWIKLRGLVFEFGLLINSISLMMLLIVTGIGSGIFYYSVEYMEEDPGFSRYFAYLSLFAFSMLGIVLSNNFLQLFIFWELVGLSSYLLIGFWYQKDSAADAGKKAFLTNRIGDFGFLIGILLIWILSGYSGPRTLNFLQLEFLLPQTALGHEPMVFWGAMFIFCGVLGKSAQFPLHVWLPDAMEGPTPVSALIHAATMVAAGVYLLARTFFIFSLSPDALQIIAYTGGLTALFAATIALVQTDLKRVLAYSTLSQLGYMVMAIGLGSVGIGMYHLTTHAFFKALLFLAAGSVLHATHEQDMRNMGGLSKVMPITTALFIIGSLALSGIYPFSGFFSKDEILALALERSNLLFWAGSITAFLTSFYITRAIIMTFFGKLKIRKKIHEPKQWMLVPMILLAILSVTAGFIGIKDLLHHSKDVLLHHNHVVPVFATFVSISALISAIYVYFIKPKLAQKIRKTFHGFFELLTHQYYIDTFYDWILQHIQKPVSDFLNKFEQKIIVDGFINGTAMTTFRFGSWVRRLQSGKIQSYLTVFLGGAVVIVYLFLIR